MTVGLNSQLGINVKVNNYASSNNVNFRGYSSNNLQYDKFESSQKKDNNKMSWFLCGLITAGMGAFAYFKLKHCPPEIKQLAEHLELKECKTINEAEQFAKDNFGIKIDTGGNLELANFINNRLVVYNNKMKGAVVIPKKVKFKNNMKTLDGSDALMGWSNWGELIINKDSVIKDLESKDADKFLYLTKAFYHELGHANHQAVCKDYEKMGTLKEMKSMFIKDRHYYDEFMNDIKNNKALKKHCSEYALTSPAEFIADVFADKIMNKKIPPEVERLYKKYGGRNVPT